MARLVPPALLCAALVAAPPLFAKTLRFASAFDPRAALRAARLMETLKP